MPALPGCEFEAGSPNAMILSCGHSMMHRESQRQLDGKQLLNRMFHCCVYLTMLQQKLPDGQKRVARE
jgi:hypothetical protein